MSQLIWILTARVEFKIPYKRIGLWNAEKLGAHDTEVYHLSCITITSGQPWPKLFWSGGQMNNGLLKWKICPRGDAGLSFIAAISVCRPPGRGERFIIMQNFMDFQFWRIKRVHNLAVRQAGRAGCLTSVSSIYQTLSKAAQSLAAKRAPDTAPRLMSVNYPEIRSSLVPAFITLSCFPFEQLICRRNMEKQQIIFVKCSSKQIIPAG